MKKYKYRILLSCNPMYPILPLCLVAERYSKYSYEITDVLLDDEWGECPEMDDDGEIKPLPDHIYLCYEGRVEMETYDIDHLLPDIDCLWNDCMTDSGISVFSQILVGISPYGKSACWLWGEKKSIVVSWTESCNTTKDEDGDMEELLEDYDEARNNLIMNGLPDKNQYDGYMQKFRYRYVTKLDDSFTFDYIEEKLFDGSHDKLHDGSLMVYHDAAKPKKLNICWHVGMSEYVAYFWFDDAQLKHAFEVCFDGKVDADMDFIIRMDPAQNKYGVVMFRYGMDEPYELYEDAYQLIVFKNDFEEYSSDNFAQEDGAWLW